MHGQLGISVSASDVINLVNKSKRSYLHIWVYIPGFLLAYQVPGHLNFIF